MIINVKYRGSKESGWAACDPSSYKAFDKAAIGISMEEKGGSRGDRGLGEGVGNARRYRI